MPVESMPVESLLVETLPVNSCCELKFSIVVDDSYHPEPLAWYHTMLISQHPILANSNFVSCCSLTG